MPWVRTGFALTLIASSIAIVGDSRNRSMSTFLDTQTYEDVYYLPSPANLRLMSLGHREGLADIVWMRALVYLGQEFQARGDLENVFRYTDSILTLDPEFRAAYEWIATAALYRPTEIDAEEAKRVIPYLREAAARFPDDGEMAWLVGATMVYDLAPMLSHEDAEAVRSEGNVHLQTAARLGGGPDWLVLSNLSQLRRVGEIEQMVRHLEEMLPIVDDPEIREELLIRLREARGASEVEATRAALEAREASWKRDRPWLPFDFYVLTAPE